MLSSDMFLIPSGRDQLYTQGGRTGMKRLEDSAYCIDKHHEDSRPSPCHRTMFPPNLLQICDQPHNPSHNAHLWHHVACLHHRPRPRVSQSWNEP